jgi:dTDP-4-amino-4,6-dideoxygalactose transaminase
LPNPYLLPNPFFRLRLIPSTEQSISLDDIVESVRTPKDGPSHFEKTFGEFVHASRALGLSSGRAALRLGLNFLSNNETNYEVVIPTFVCGAVADAIISAGGTPVLCDVKSTDGTIDPSKIKNCISPKTKAIVAVHYQGLPSDIDEIMEIGVKYGIPVIEDCAHALGSKIKNKVVGSFGDFAFFSFGPDKPISTGNGGMLTTTRTDFQEKFVQATENLPKTSFADELHILKILLEINLLSNYRTYGISSFTYFPALNFPLAAIGFKPKYPLQRISEIGSKIGQKQLSLIDRIIQMRILNSCAISKGLANSKTVIPIESSKNKTPVLLRYTVLLKSQISREYFMRKLKRAGIEAGPINWRRPLHLLHSYSNSSRRCMSYEGADEFASRFINLPCHPFVTESDIAKIVACSETI